MKAPGHFADLTSGLVAAIDTMAALVARGSSGGGRHIDLSEQEVLATTIRTELAAYTYERALPGRIKVRKRSGGMLYACKGGYVVMSGTGEGFWPGLVKMMGSPGWTQEAWCSTGVARNENVERVNEMVTQWSSRHTPDEVELLAFEHRVPCAAVRTVGDLKANQQLQARGFFVEADHPRAGRLPYPGAPYKFSKTPWRLASAAPLLGQHNDEVWCGLLGYGKEALVRMRKSGVI